MKLIGVTGGSGAGKSALCQQLKKLGATIVDSDKISREVSKAGGRAYDEIVQAFGGGILKEDNEIDRKALAEIVFNDKAKLELLNDITHKHIFAEMKKQISDAKSDIIVLDVPLLFKTDFPIKCDLTVAVIAPIEVRISRIMVRDSIDRQEAIMRIKNQMSDEEYRYMADICYENNQDEASMLKFAESICQKDFKF